MSDYDVEQYNTDEEGHSRLEQRTFLLMLALVSVLFLYLLQPFFTAIFWACVVAILFYPLQQYLLDHWKRPNLAALATLGICVLVAVAPTLFLLGAMFEQGSQLYQRLQNGEIDPSQYVARIREGFPMFQAFVDRLPVDLDALKDQASGAAVTISRWLAQNALSIGQNMLNFFVSLGLMLYLLFFLLRDGPRLVDLLIRAIPIGDTREKMLFDKFAEVTRATVKGNLVVAIIQGGLGGVIFWLLGIPGAVFWGVVMVLLSLIPVVGAGIIWVPVAIYLFAVGDWGKGLVLTLFGALVIGLVDNLLRPVLVGRDTKLPDFLVLLSTLGGLVLFGLSGFVLGPLIAALFVVFWQIFVLDFHNLPSVHPPEDTLPADEDGTEKNGDDAEA